MAEVEIPAGLYRVVSLLSREALDDLKLAQATSRSPSSGPRPSSSRLRVS